MSVNYDLEERTAKFGENIIILCKKIGINDYNKSIINQVIRSATSIGANYMEANGVASKKDFINKIYICKKETQETKHWLRMLSTTNEEIIEELRFYWKEAQELTLIFQRIIMSCRKKKEEIEY